MENKSNLTNNVVTTGWIKTTKETSLSAANQLSNTKEPEEKIVSRVTFEPNLDAPVSFNTYQDILDCRNQMLGTVKPCLHQYDAY